VREEYKRLAQKTSPRRRVRNWKNSNSKMRLGPRRSSATLCASGRAYNSFLMEAAAERLRIWKYPVPWIKFYDRIPARSHRQSLGAVGPFLEGHRPRLRRKKRHSTALRALHNGAFSVERLRGRRQLLFSVFRPTSTPPPPHLPALKMPGGYLRFIVGDGMVNDRMSGPQRHRKEARGRQSQGDPIAIFPLGIPRRSGPGRWHGLSFSPSAQNPLWITLHFSLDLLTMVISGWSGARASVSRDDRRTGIQRDGADHGDHPRRIAVHFILRGR